MGHLKKRKKISQILTSGYFRPP